MRDYDPTTGRYIQADPLGLVDGASVYGYALQNPGRYSDFKGENSTLGGNDPAFNDPSMIPNLEKELKDPDTSQRRKNQIRKRLKELKRRPSKRAHQKFEACDGDCATKIGIGALLGTACFCILFPQVCIPALAIGGGAAALTQ